MRKFIIIIFLPILAFSQQRYQKIKTAQRYERLGRYEDAAEIYKGLYQENPDNPIFFNGLKRNYLQLKRYDELITLIEKGLKRSPRNFQLRISLGDVYCRAGEREKALQLWEDVIKDFPSTASVYRSVAMSLIQNRLFEEAIELYKKGRKRVGSKTLFALDLANLYVGMLNYKEATEEYLNFLEERPNQLSFVENRLLSLANDPEAFNLIIQVLKEKVNRNKENILFRKLLAGFYLRAEEYEKAFQQYQGIERMLRGTQALSGQEIFRFAETALKEGAYEHAERAYQELLQGYPKFPHKIRANFGLAQSYQGRGLLDKAISWYEKIIRTYPESPWAAEAYLRIGDIKFKYNLREAIEAFSTVLTKFPKGPQRFQAMFRLSDCLIAKGDITGAKEKIYQAMQEGKLQNGIVEQALFKLAELDFMEGKFDEALRKFNEVVGGSGGDFQGDYINDALEYILLIEENQEQPEALLLYAQALNLIKMRKYLKAIEKLKTLVDNYPKAPLNDRVFLQIGELNRLQGKFKEAIRAYQRLIDGFPQSTLCDLAQERIGEVYERDLKDIPKAQQAYELVLTKYPDSLLADSVRKRIRRLERR